MKLRRKSRSPASSAGLCLLALAIGGASLCAELLVHEPFDYERRQGYTSDTNLGVGIVGLNGGIGFSGGWWLFPATTSGVDLNAGIPEGEGDYGSGDTYGVSLGARTGPLAYMDENRNALLTSGNQVRMAFGNRSWNRRDLSSPIGQGGETYWLSFLAQANGLSTATNRWAFVELSSGGSGRLWLGNINAVVSGNWALELPDRSAGVVRRDLGHPMNVPTLFLARFDYSPDWDGMTVSIWFDPPDLTDEQALPEPVYQVTTDFIQFTTLGVAGRFSTDFDEIRIGTTFDAVTPSEFVPLPSEPPALVIAREGETVTLSWPAAATGFTLYSSDDLVTWAPVSEQPVVQGDFNVVEVTTSEDRLFFRLQQ